jgi:hypothetical protein
MFDTALNAQRATPTLRARTPKIDVDRVDEFLRAYVPVRWKTARAKPGSIDSAAAAVLDALLDPSLCATQAGERDALRPTLLAQITPAITLGAPIDLFLDLGHGYRASVQPGREALTFEVGLGEWFLLGQIARLGRGVAALYAPGVRFHLVVDNLFAAQLYRVPIADTERYCAWLRALISASGLDPLVRVLVESEHVAAEQFGIALDAELARTGSAEAAAGPQPRRQAAAAAISNRLLSTLIDGPRMSLQSSGPTHAPSALRLRTYPLGDGRIGAGETCLAHSNGRLRPTVVTRLNCGRYLRVKMIAPPCLPDLIRAITIASPWPTEH